MMPVSLVPDCSERINIESKGKKMFSYLKGRPVTYAISSIYAFVFALFYLLYGGVKIILSFLDNSFSSMGELILVTILGLLLMTFAVAYRELKNWGWYGLIAVNSLVVLLGLFTLSEPGNTAVLILSAGVLYTLLARETRECLSVSS
jgi:hypothetical protein